MSDWELASDRTKGGVASAGTAIDPIDPGMILLSFTAALSIVHHPVARVERRSDHGEVRVVTNNGGDVVGPDVVHSGRDGNSGM